MRQCLRRQVSFSLSSVFPCPLRTQAHVCRLQHKVSARAQSAISDPTHPEEALVPLNKGPLFSTQTGRLHRQILANPVGWLFSRPAGDRPDHRLSEQGRPGSTLPPAENCPRTAPFSWLLPLSVPGLEKRQSWHFAQGLRDRPLVLATRCLNARMRHSEHNR